ncbi:MAG: phosphoglucosamine mutase [Candidatus Neomarinimicrobiota bacterium]|nr:phosphoglucosamine mutase [Candidatus Neomarinimicrobiota bacterium]
MLIRSASGLRGIVEDDFSPDIIDRYIASFILTQNITHCVIGRDGRPSGKEISQLVIDSLNKYGVNVDNCDLATTPTMQLMAEKEQYDGGIVITASHNPSEYNGLKFLQKDGTFLSLDQCNTLFASVDNCDRFNEPEIVGKLSMYNSANEEHINKVLNAKCIETDNIQSKKFKVVIDAVNGGGSDILPQLCKDLGCDVTMINCNGDGNFTRIPEPLSSNLKDLENKVIEVGADIGFATDPDGDRLSIVSNEGKAIGEEYTLVLAFKNFIKYKRSMIVTNLSTSKMIDDISSGSIRTKIGEAHVVEKMKESNILIGGEGNGGVILNEVHLGRDSLVAAAMILNLLSTENKSINAVIDEIPKYIFIKDKITLDNSKDFDFDNLATVFDCNEINRDDGIKFSWPEKWIHIRKSNTEPIIRIFAEAKTESEVNSLIQILKDYLE